MFSDTFAGIAPSSVPPFIAAQLIGAVVGIIVIHTLHPDTATTPGRAVAPSDALSS
jgi:glycerol uptake facilitator-like aquaporin